MALTAHQMEQRKGRVTASNVPAILGMDKYKSPRQAFMEITGQAEDDAGEAARIGTFFEDAVLALFQFKSGKKIKRRNIRRVAPDIDLAATLDAELEDEDAAVEAKTTGIASYGNLADWGEEGTDEVPERVVIQTAAQMIAAPEKRLVYVPLVGGGIGYRGYVVHRDEDLCGLVRQGVERFITDFLKPMQMPPPDWRDMDGIKAMERIEGRTRTLSDDTVGAFLKAKMILQVAEKDAETARARLLEELGDAEIGKSSLATISYKRCKDIERFDKEAFAEAKPDLYRAFLKVTPGFRTLRCTPKGAKAGVA